MRRSLAKVARGASNTARHETSFRTPFICLHCRRTALGTSGITAWTNRRPFASTILWRQQSSTAEAQNAQKESLTPQTHYDLFADTFPSGPPPNSPFTLDLKQLRREFLQLQAKSHPDLAPSDRKRQAEAISMRLNEAYNTILDPLRRAQYLLALKGIDVEDESAKLSENELLMEVMAAREAVEEVENEEELVGLREENNERIEASVNILNGAFATADLEQAAREAIRLRYWMNIEESIQGWEKGAGGGILHH